MPIRQERGNLAEEAKYATQIFKNFVKHGFRSSEDQFALNLNHQPAHVGCYD
jgi:hypothetical protein